GRSCDRRHGQCYHRGPLTFSIRRALDADKAQLNALIERSARELSTGWYTPEQIDSAVRHVFGVDSNLVADGTYFVVTEGAEVVGCGGWSRRRTLYGGDQRPVAVIPSEAPAPSEHSDEGRNLHVPSV